MSKLAWPVKAAKRIVAEAALRAAIVEVEKSREVGGPREYGSSGNYKVARALAHHAAEQLRLSDGEGE